MPRMSAAEYAKGEASGRLESLAFRAFLGDFDALR